MDLQVHVNAELVCACVYIVNIFLENGKYMK